MIFLNGESGGEILQNNPSKKQSSSDPPLSFYIFFNPSLYLVPCLIIKAIGGVVEKGEEREMGPSLFF